MSPLKLQLFGSHSGPCGIGMRSLLIAHSVIISSSVRGPRRRILASFFWSSALKRVSAATNGTLWCTLLVDLFFARLVVVGGNFLEDLLLCRVGEIEALGEKLLIGDALDLVSLPGEVLEIIVGGVHLAERSLAVSAAGHLHLQLLGGVAVIRGRNLHGEVHSRGVAPAIRRVGILTHLCRDAVLVVVLLHLRGDALRLALDRVIRGAAALLGRLSLGHGC